MFKQGRINNRRKSKCCKWTSANISVNDSSTSTWFSKITLSKIDKDDKNKEIIDKIKEIFINNKEKYGYHIITLELRNQGYNVNHKKVYKIMVKLGLKPLKRNKRKFIL